MRFHKIVLLLSGVLMFKPAVAQQRDAGKPNIIFILADDLGYGNLSSYNPKTPVSTPNIDKLAQEGTKFTRFYAGSTVCAPSRASLMTGKHMGNAYVRGNGNVSLRAKDTTLAEYLQRSGYVTGMFGKWGLGLENEPGAPHLKGFDSFYGYLLQRHAHYYFTDHLFQVKDKKLTKVKVDSSQYTQDLIMENALTFIQDHKDRPFFLYLSTTLPHAELQVPDTLLRRFQHADGTSKFAPEKPYIRKGESYHTQLQPRAAFAAMMYRLDQDIARLMQQLKQLGIDENTYVFFTSDNGPHQEGGGDPEFFDSNGPLKGLKRDLYEGGIRVPLLVRAPGKVPAGKERNDIWAFWDVLPTLGSLTQTATPSSIDGISFANALKGQKQAKQHDYLYWQFNEGNHKEAIMQGDWKLIRFKEKGKAEVLELYNLRTDVGEEKNVATANPAKVKALRALMEKAKSPAEHPLFDWSAVEN
ncbi:arylsulfatase [Pedobacter sp. SYSU D00535]|uniref:arylsulfatase n=1 Tax=Pedobacter sp. SYSU D00535 TaxID=2810308 RepID=UPI001A966300|nr:arylsulfatase [Pedobacter sp. SYSU D00535]